MTKGELVVHLIGVPDDAEVRIGGLPLVWVEYEADYEGRAIVWLVDEGEGAGEGEGAAGTHHT